jgi:hypothetical protein
MEGRKLMALAGVRVAQRRGPKSGANVFVTYELTFGADLTRLRREQAHATPVRPLSSPRSQQNTAPTLGSIDLSGALVLVSCVKQKRSTPAPAKDLYTSTFFRLARRLVERHNADWLILSAKFGLLDPSREVEPYEQTLNSMPVTQRRAWAEKALVELLPLAQRHDRVVFLAGQKYREFLIPALRHEEIRCEEPMAHLRQGEQLAWLGAQ